MLVKIIIKGEMGKRFGKEWDLHVNTPNEALRLIDANVGGLFRWIRANLPKYESYKVLCEFPDGKREYMNTNTYFAANGVSKVTFIPVVAGASGKIKAVAGVVLMIAAVALEYFSGGTMTAVSHMIFMTGMSLTIGGVVEMMAPKPKANNAASENINSHYFNGSENVIDQGSPVQLIYGECLVGSQVVSAGVTTAQIII